ncbi:MAG: asparagine synthase (glutamine-hydrolyzing) [Actinomycetota bacterium]|nr:asparagine synthase (glutamine-hydrolyzing) [Actinomycetota bacterium]
MCGIAGHVTLGQPGADSSFVEAACLAMLHRGPDEAALHSDARAALGIARLRVVGLVGGSQPARDSTGSVVCVVNGEIYNHRALRAMLAARGRHVTGTSDVHVVPELYAEFGDEFVQHLEGMFAIALYDAARGRLLLVSDRFGKKPLFYTLLGLGGVAFASELTALMQHPDISRKLDPSAIDQYLSYRMVPAPHTIYEHVRKLRPATLMAVDSYGVTERTYWHQDFNGSLRATPRAEIVEHVDFLLNQAVTDRLESDVPLGAMLSGGLDSSLVVALAQRSLGRDLDTFSIGFESTAFDETQHAEAIATRFGTRHHVGIVRAHDAAAVTDDILRLVGEPYGFPSAIASWAMYELAASDATVVLTGDGSDEIFCGYSRYQRLADSTAPGDLSDRYESVLVDGVPGEIKAALYRPEFRANLPDFPHNYLRARFERTDASASDLERAMQVDATFWLSDAQLVKIDRMAMAHSVEPRSPMLDHRLVGFVRRIPAEMNLNSGVEKQILKEVAARYLPAATVTRRKQELAVPLEEWLTTSLRPTIESTLLSEPSLERGYFAPDRLRAFVTDYRPEHSYAIWTLYMLERWHQLAIDRASGHPATAVDALHMSPNP